MQPVFLIAYTLRHQSDYSHIHQALQALQAFPLDGSLWLLRGNYTAQAIHDRLRPVLRNADDMLFVAQVSNTNWKLSGGSPGSGGMVQQLLTM